MPVVFISSTSEDLGEYRAAVRDVVLTAKWQPEMMEYFVASGRKPPLEECLERISHADVVVVIVAYRYGWVPPDQAGDEHKSITWLECERAVEQGKQVLAFLVDESHPWDEKLKEQFRLAEAAFAEKLTSELIAEVPRNLSRLAAFKQWLNSQGVRATFTSPDNLGRKVVEALREWLQQQPDAQPLPPLPADPEAYLEDLLEKTSHIDVRGLHVGKGQAHRFPIDQLYISLTTSATAERRRPRDKQDDAQRLTMPRKIPLHQAISHDRLVVVGDPGAGKTTFLRRVAYAICRAELGKGEDPDLPIQDRRFPVFIRVSELAQHMLHNREHPGAPTGEDAPAWLWHFLAAASKSNSWGLEEDYFRQQLEGGACTVMLDGLDEAPERTIREQLSKTIENAAKACSGCRFLVTTRPTAYTSNVVLASFSQAQIDPLADEAVETFLSKWCRTLYAESPSTGEEHCRELLDALHARPDIRRMARNPVMLTALAVVHWNERRLPEQRADLYASIIRWLSRSREQRPGREKADRTVELLRELALAMQNHPDGMRTQVSKRWAAEMLAPEWPPGKVDQKSIARAEQFLSDEEMDSGIIVARGSDVQFWHRSFQEYLAARAIAARSEKDQQELLWGPPVRLYDTEWREVVLLLGGSLHQQGREKVDNLIRTMLKRLGRDAGLAEEARCAGLLGGILRDLGPTDYEPPTDARFDKLLDRVMSIFAADKSASVAVDDRIAAADALGQAGDPRIDFGREAYWVTIPAGQFPMGAQSKDSKQPNYDEEAYDDESPVHEVFLDAFRIARYPVTVGQYQQFVEHEGYSEDRWWSAGGFGEFTEPEAWDEQRRYPSRPVVGVSWYEAAAFSAWAKFRLPTEAEWERAARGTEGRKYPWGSEAPNEARTNFDGNIGHPSPVGIFPRDATPDGVYDLGGNVNEWCADWFDENYYANSPASNPAGPPEASSRVIRGGCWDGYARNCRAADRGRDGPQDRADNLGFRVAAVPPGGAGTQKEKAERRV